MSTGNEDDKLKWTWDPKRGRLVNLTKPALQNKGAPQEGVEGAWCGDARACTPRPARTPAERTCIADRPALARTRRRCTGCKNVNFGTRDSCHRCSTPKPPQHILDERIWAIQSGSAPSARWPNGAPKEGVDGNWACGNCGNVNWVMRTTCHRCDADIPTPELLEKRLQELMADRAEQAERVALGLPREQPKEGVRDSWKCPACRNINFKQRRACHRCNEPKPPPEVLAARKEQEERRAAATERRRLQQLEEEKQMLEEQEKLKNQMPPPPLLELMPRLVQCQGRQRQMQQIMLLLQQQLDVSKRIATQQAAMLATADLVALGADPEAIAAAEQAKVAAAEKAEREKKAAAAAFAANAIAIAAQLAAKAAEATKAAVDGAVAAPAPDPAAAAAAATDDGGGPLRAGSPPPLPATAPPPAQPAQATMVHAPTAPAEALAAPPLPAVPPPSVEPAAPSPSLQPATEGPPPADGGAASAPAPAAPPPSAPPAVPPAAPPAAPTAAPPAAPPAAPSATELYGKMNLTQLKARAEKLGLDATGLKPTLMKRLVRHHDGESADPPPKRQAL